MIARLSGKVIELEKKSLILDVGGVGYRLAVLASLLGSVRVGQDLTLRVHHHVGDGIEDLYGFQEAESLEFFKLLLSVPSVGPRTAIGILDVAPPRVLEQAVVKNDIKMLTKVGGVGKKTAQRILIELKGKIKDVKPEGAASDIQEEAMIALMSMGYTKGQARDSVQKLPEEIVTVEEAVRWVLKAKA